MRIDWYVLGFVVLISQSSARQIGFEPGPSAKGLFARGKTYTLTLSPDEAALRLDKSVLRMKLLGAGAGAGAEPLEQLPGKANYFIGNDPAQWRTNVPMYAKVAYREVYRGV